jgi:16S rRNA C967 or C1407 C5-methylase (RsmB/RsmF family)
MQVAMGIMAIINGISMAVETSEERLERLTKEAEELGNKAKEVKANFKTLETGKK